jgi:hypothetical protein
MKEKAGGKILEVTQDGVDIERRDAGIEEI